MDNALSIVPYLRADTSTDIYAASSQQSQTHEAGFTAQDAEEHVHCLYSSRVRAVQRCFADAAWRRLRHRSESQVLTTTLKPRVLMMHVRTPSSSIYEES